MSALFAAFLTASAAMSVVILLLLLLNTCSANKVSAVLRYYLWLIVLAGLLIPFRPSVPLPFEPLGIAAQLEVGFAQDAAGAAEAEPAQSAGTLSQPAATMLPSDAAKPPDNTTQAAAPAVSLAAILGSIWLTGVLAVLFFHGWSYRKFTAAIRRWGAEPPDNRVHLAMQAAKRNMGLEGKAIAVKECAFIASPMMAGFFHPVILLPEKPITPDELDYIFKHELTHYRRKDVCMNLLVMLVSAVHWFNPLVHLMAKAIRADCEAACDEKVLAGDCSDTRRRYGETIIGFIGARNTHSPVLSTYFYGGSNSMKKRLTSIMDTGKKNKGLAVILVMAVAVVTVLASAALSAPHSAAEPIGEAKAKAIALKHAAVTEQQAFFVRVYLDYDDGRAVYDVEFYSGNKEYDYEIDAASGKIREYDRDIEAYAIPGNASSNAAASTGSTKRYAVAPVTGSANSSAVTPATNSTNNAAVTPVTGSTKSKAVAPVTANTNTSAAAPATNSSAASSQDIGEAKAKAIALSAAGLTESQAGYIEISYDYEHARGVYEVDFRNGWTEYEYEIDAASGAILHSDVERDD